MDKLRAVETLPLVNEDAVEKLEHALEQVRTGDVESVAISIVRRDGYSQSHWSQTDSLPTLLGAVNCMAYKLARRMAGDE